MKRSISILIACLTLALVIGCGRKKTTITAPTTLSNNSLETTLGKGYQFQEAPTVEEKTIADLSGCLVAADAIQKSFAPPDSFPVFNLVVAPNSTKPASCTSFSVQQVLVVDEVGSNIAVNATGFAVGTVAQVLNLRILRAGNFHVSVKLAAVGSPSTTRTLVLPLAVVQIAAPVPPAPPIMVSEVIEVSDEGSSISRTFKNTVPVVINVAGNVRGSYVGPTGNAGVNATVSVDGEVCSAFFSFEAFSSTISFQSAATCTRLLQPGTHTIRVHDSAVGYPHMSGYVARMQYYATPVESVLLASEVVADATSVSTEEIQIAVPSVIQVSGHITGNYHNSVGVNAGVNAAITIDGDTIEPDTCASNFSFEARSHSISFHSAVSCSKYLAPGKYTIKLRDLYAGRASMSLYKSRLQFMVLPATRILARNELSSTATHALTETLSLTKAGIIDISGWVSGNYYAPGNTGNAGVMVTITVDDVPCTSSFSFEALSSSITFDSSARCIKRLAAGSHTIKVFDHVAGDYPHMGGKYHSKMSYFVLPE